MSEQSEKAFLLDTNVVVTDPESIHNFEDNYVVILEASINEIDRFKKEQTARGATSREFVRILSRLKREETLGSYSSDPENRFIFISNEDIRHVAEHTKIEHFDYLKENNFDEIIINFYDDIFHIIRSRTKNVIHDEDSVILVSNDNVLRARLELMTNSFKAEPYKHNQVDAEKIYTNETKILDLNEVLTKDEMTIYLNLYTEYKHRKDSLARHHVFDIFGFLEDEEEQDNKISFKIYKAIISQCIPINSLIQVKHECISKYYVFINIFYNYQLVFGEASKTKEEPYLMSFNFIALNENSNNELPHFSSKENGIYGIYPKNLEQYSALQILNTDHAKLVALTGRAGTGKTLVALAYSLQQVTNNYPFYTKVTLVKTIEEIGKEMGSLPGNVEEKMEPFLQSFYDCFDVLHTKGDKETKGRKAFKDLVFLDILEVQPLAYMRGRTFTNKIIIVDEAQNCTYEQLKTIITRAGANCKIILCGDPDQRDLSFMTKNNNGLTQIIDKMKGQNIFAHVNFVEGERSLLADIAGKIL